MEWMPQDARTSIIRHLPETEAETGWTGLPLIAEAMARGLAFANRGIAESHHLTQAQVNMRDWIRDTMDLADREGLFGGFRMLYAGALARNSAPAIHELVEGSAAASIIGGFILGSRDGEMDLNRFDRHGMFDLGHGLGQGAVRLNQSAILYGTESGLFPGLDFGLTQELKARALRLGPRPGGNFELVEAELFEMLRGLENIRQGVENDWGSIHPLAQGYGKAFEGSPWIREQGVERIRRAVDEVEDFITQPRH
ncbi:MAG TPA: hypothetical protein VFW62_10220 [bacterium]|nr:hypothetical protein [bacterium]